MVLVVVVVVDAGGGCRVACRSSLSIHPSRPISWNLPELWPCPGLGTRLRISPLHRQELSFPLVLAESIPNYIIMWAQVLFLLHKVLDQSLEVEVG